MHSMMWHRVFAQVELGAVPVVAVLKGAVVGGGLELAVSAHIRIAERSAYYALPEGQRGIFVGGGASVRVPRLIGVARMADMMLTGRMYNAEEGQALGISQYLVESGAGLAKALDLSARIAANSPVTNFAVIQALPRIAETNPHEGFLMEALMAAIAQGSDEAKNRMRAFLEKRGKKVTEF
jgi:enoyl-CoA hydratase/carnithine racemase